MKRRVAFLLALVLALALLPGLGAADHGLHVIDLTDPDLDPSDLAEALAGEGVVVDIESVRFVGHPEAAGGSSGGTGIIGFGNGVILSSGRAKDVVGPNEAPDTSTNFEQPGDKRLSELSGFDTYDAAILEFEFEVGETAQQVFFQYVFGSEEYNEFVGSQFNDVFAFWVNDVNCAVVPDPDDPGEAVPVSINTINHGWAPDGFEPVNPELYINNDPFDGDHVIYEPLDVEAAPYNTEMDGFTSVLTCEAAVAEGTNSMRLAIADASDAHLDSWVLIEAGSLTTAPPDESQPFLPPPEGLAAEVEVDTVTLSWDPPSEPAPEGWLLEGYRVYRDAILIGEVEADEDGVVPTTFDDVGVAPGTYPYAVSAVYVDIRTEFPWVAESDRVEIEVVVGEPFFPPPRNLSGVVDGDVVTLDWDAPDLDGLGFGLVLDSYRVYRDGALIGAIEADEDGVVPTTFNDVDAAPGTYTYGVTAFYTGLEALDGESAPVEAAVTVPPVLVFAPPEDLVAEVEVDTVTLSWEAPSVPPPDGWVLSGYRVYRDGEPIADGVLADNSFIEENVAPGVYSYAVTAVYTEVMDPDDPTTEPGEMESSAAQVDLEVADSVPPPDDTPPPPDDSPPSDEDPPAADDSPPLATDDGPTPAEVESTATEPIEIPPPVVAPTETVDPVGEEEAPSEEPEVLAEVIEEPEVFPEVIEEPGPPTLDALSTPPGGRVTLGGDGCTPGDEVVATIDGIEVGVDVADADGRFSVDVAAPSRPGVFELEVACGDITRTVLLTVALTTSTAGVGSSVVATALMFFILLGSALWPRRPVWEGEAS